MKFKNISTLINGNNYFQVNREVARAIGINASIILSEILDKYTYFQTKGVLQEDGWFYLTVDDVEDRTTLAKDAQDGAIKILKKYGLVDKKQAGMPAKRYFKVNEKKIVEWVDSSFLLEETRQQESNNSPNKKEELSTTAPIYTKEPKEEPNSLKERREDGASPPNPPPPSFMKRGLVLIKEEGYRRLVGKYTFEVVEDTIQSLNLYAQATPGKFKKYKSHEAVVEMWILKDKKQGNSQWKTKTERKAFQIKSTNSNLESSEPAMREPQFLTPDSMQEMLKEYFPG